MTFDAMVARVFLASPGDTVAERILARAVINHWNVNNASDEHVVLLPVGWETDAIPEWGDHPQSILNRQLLDSCDVLIGMFWARIGTATPGSTSGTVEEIERFAATGKPVLLYFCRKPVDPATIDPEQLKGVRAFEAACRNRSLYDEYGDAAEFEAKLMRALTMVVRAGFPNSSGLPRGTRLAGPPRVRAEARLSARLSRSDHQLTISNTGTVEIHNVTVELPPEASSLGLAGDELPIDVLRPGEAVGLQTFTFMGGGKSIFDIRLRGQTPEGEDVSFLSKVSI